MAALTSGPDPTLIVTLDASAEVSGGLRIIPLGQSAAELRGVCAGTRTGEVLRAWLAFRQEQYRNQRSLSLDDLLDAVKGWRGRFHQVDLAAELGCSEDTVYRVLRDEGLTWREFRTVAEPVRRAHRSGA